jgi:hypothetical protein
MEEKIGRENRAGAIFLRLAPRQWNTSPHPIGQFPAGGPFRWPKPLHKVDVQYAATSQYLCVRRWACAHLCKLTYIYRVLHIKYTHQERKWSYFILFHLIFLFSIPQLEHNMAKWKHVDTGDKLEFSCNLHHPRQGEPIFLSALQKTQLLDPCWDTHGQLILEDPS